MLILVVDDDASLREWVRIHLEELGHRVAEAESGLAAVESVQRERPDVVLLDILMPGMDGCQTALRLRKACPQPYLPILFFTAISDAGTLSRCLEIGDGFIQKPVDIRVLRAKLEAFDRWSRMAYRLQRQNRKLQEYRARTEQEIEVCRHILRQALSANRESLPGIRTLHTEASTLGGDLLLMHERPDGGAYILIGDFTGYGLSAMVAALPVYERFFELARRGSSVMLMARELNALLNAALPPQMFMAATLAEVDAARRHVSLWCGGLPDGKVFNVDGELVEYLNSAHPPLGVLADHRFQSYARTLTLQSGDRLYLYTDALPESPVEGTPLGESRVQSLLAEPGDALQRVRDALVRGSLDEQAALRGMTLVEVLGGVQGQARGLASRTVSQPHLPAFCLKWTIAGDALRGESPLGAVIAWCEQVPALREQLAAIQLVLTELFQNVRDYQLLGVPPRREYYEQLEAWERQQQEALSRLTSGTVDVVLESLSDGHLTVSVTGRRDGVDLDKPEISGWGRGLSMVAELAGHVEAIEGGLRARLRVADEE
ncbi:MAG: fused response regulator/phosphatase [Gammaproteobacteria bacterium]|nr:MAG: fused response regulator/phosphatase [Gammaproteobacteria bacterium]